MTWMAGLLPDSESVRARPLPFPKVVANGERGYGTKEPLRLNKFEDRAEPVVFVDDVEATEGRLGGEGDPPLVSSSEERRSCGFGVGGWLVAGILGVTGTN